ncbi:jg8401 [Pararge aegeria aegeria]|uniref:Jg8401 protein n=1 Tax=Pararge aegeria aegeria TaxID=348720 RepID=A0A8S4SGZ5_9NEOP|nr:jg8401 [Pararge aegeria aegeria]
MYRHLRSHHSMSYQDYRRNSGNKYMDTGYIRRAKVIRLWSWTRKYYCKVNERFIKCKICERFLKKSSNKNGNIHRHIKLKHPYIYFKENNQKRSAQDGDSSLEETDEAVEQVFYIKDLTRVKSKDNNSEAQDDEVLNSDIDENVDKIPDANNIEHHASLSEVDVKIQDKCNKTVLGKQFATTNTRRYYSWTRKYYNKINDKFIKCRICKRVLKMNISNNGNILRHIKQKHPDIYFNETYSNESTKELVDDDSNLKEFNKARPQVIYIKELDKKETQDNNTEVRDDNLFGPRIGGSIDNMSDVEETEHSVSKTKKELNIKSPSDEVVEEKRINATNDRRNRSWTRKYYYKINNRLIKCRICHRLLNMNIHRHIKTKHPDIYLKENPKVQDPDIKEELRMKNLCEKTAIGVRARTNKSCIWNFFEIVEQDRLYQCSFCQKTVAIFPKNVFNLKRHISNAHKKQYDIIMKYGDLEPRDSENQEAANPEVPGVSSVEIAFLSLDDENSGKFKCTRCEEIIESTEEESDSVLIEHVHICQLKPAPEEIETDAKIIKSIEEQNIS